MKKAVITGANGFIGTALCKELSAQGVRTIAIVRNSSINPSEISNLPNLKTICCDLSDIKNLDNYISEKDIDVFYHLAWSGSAGEKRKDYNVQLDNIRYTCDAIQACSSINCKRFVFASSIMEYEFQAAMTTKSFSDLHALYSVAKLTANYMAKIIAESKNIDYIRAIISNVYGPGEKNPRLINTSLRKMLSGEHCRFSPGEQLYDFIYITDAAKAFIAIGDKGHSQKSYYIGSQHPHKLKDFLYELQNQIDPSIEIGIGELPFRGNSLSYNEFDIFALKNDTGFVPSVSFSEGIRKTINWIKEEI